MTVSLWNKYDISRSTGSHNDAFTSWLVTDCDRCTGGFWRRRFGMSGGASSSVKAADLRLRGTNPDCFGRDGASMDCRRGVASPDWLSLMLPRLARLAATSATERPVRSTPCILSAEYFENLSRFSRSRPHSRSISSLSTCNVRTPTLSLQLVSVFLCQPVPPQFYLIYGFYFILLWTDILSLSVFSCTYIYVLLFVLNKDQSINHNTGCYDLPLATTMSESRLTDC